MILTQQLLTNTTQSSSKAALRYLGKDILYKDLLASVARLSYLYQHEMPGTIRMAFFCRNSPALVMTFLAMTNIRAVSIPLNPDALSSEIAACLKESKATHLAVTSDLVGKARDLLHSEHINIPIIDIEKKQGGEYATSFTPPPEQTPKDADTILLLRSGGYSSKPKFAAFSHRQLIHTGIATRAHHHLSPQDRFHTVLPWAIPFAFVHALLIPLMMGSTCIIDHGLQAVELLDFLTESRVSRIVGTPAFFLKFLMVCKNEKRVLPSFKSAIVGLGSLSPELKRAFDVLKVPVAHCYGQVENLWTIAMQDTQDPGELPEGYVKGFMGKGLAGFKYKVVDAQGDEVAHDGRRVGQLALSGPTMMLGYPDHDKATKQALRGTWLYTGDYVQLDGTGETLTLTLVGRKEDLNENDLIDPLNLDGIDSIIKRHAAVQDGASFFIKNSLNEQVLMCAVVKAPNTPLNEKQFMEYLNAQGGSGLLPRIVAFTDEIPRDLGNNVNYLRLRARFSGAAG